MSHRALLALVFAVLLAGVSLPDAQAQTKPKSRQGRGYRPGPQPRSADEVKLAPGTRIGVPLALTTDYMGRPLKPKTATKPKPKPAQGASSMSAKGSASAASSASATKAAGAKSATAEKKSTATKKKTLFGKRRQR